MLQRETRPVTCLGERERDVLRAVAGAAIPAGNLLPGAGPATVARTEAYLAGLPSAVLRGFRGILWALDADARVRHHRSLASLDVHVVEKLLERWRAGGWAQRMALRALVTPLKVVHYGEPSFYRGIGCRWEPEPSRPERPRWMERVSSGAEVAGETLEADVVVVGTGAGGAAVAKELAEKGLAVLMVEEGEYWQRSDFTGRAMDIQRKMYRNLGAYWTLGNVAIPIPVGCSVGGSTTINSGTCYRTPERVFAEWRLRHGLGGFSAETMAPYYERVESVLRVERTRPEHIGGVGRAIARGCEALGFAHRPLLRNAPDCDGQGLCCFGCPTDAKRSTNVSYVPLALQKGAMLVKGMRVERVLVENGRAVGVEGRVSSRTGRRSDRKITVRANAVVVAAGTLLTPGLLEASGIGARSGQLGRNLSIHPAAAVMALFDEQIDGWRGVPQGYSIEEFHEEGLLFEGAFAPPEVGSINVTQLGSRFVEIMEAYDRIACFGFLIEDTSRGRVRTVKGSPVLTYWLNDVDVARIKRGIEILARVYFAAGARTVLPPVHGFDELRDPGDLEKLARASVRASDLDLSAYHPLGTARMGVDARASVVGTSHEVHDTPGCYVVDGSVMPTSLAVNPQMTIMALATRAADLLADRMA